LIIRLRFLKYNSFGRGITIINVAFVIAILILTGISSNFILDVFALFSSPSSSSSTASNNNDISSDPPSIKVPPNLFVEAVGLDGARVTYSASASDSSGNKITVNCNPSSGSIFSIGTNTVICSAANATATKSFQVTVRDTRPPLVSVPADMTLEATGPEGRVVNYNANAVDIVDGNLAATCYPSSGSAFALGHTKVKCTAVDKAGNIGSNSFIITVRDTTPPETILENTTVGWLGSISYGDITPSDDINFEFYGNDLVGIGHYDCRIDGGPWESARTSVANILGDRINICTYTGISSIGAHSFQVRAVDTSGNIDPSPPNFRWEIESPLKAVQELIMQVRTIGSYDGLESSLHQVVEILSDRTRANDGASCYLLDSFMNDIKIRNLVRTMGFSDQDSLARTSLTIMGTIGCPPPIADAGPPQTVDAGKQGVVLDGSDSLYADNHASFRWEQVGGSPIVKIRNSGSPKASFDAPSTSQFSENGKSTTLVFQLTVSGTRRLESSGITTVEINAPNHPPVASSQGLTITRDTSASITLDASDKDGDSLTYSIKSFPAHGSLGSFDKYTGSVIYNPNKGYTGSDSFTFTASDGTSTSNTAKVSITINPVTPINTPPIVKNQIVSTLVNSPINITLRVSDADGDPIRSTIISNASNGTLTGLNQTTHILTYTPNTNFTGLDSFTHKANDGKEDSNIGKVTVIVRNLFKK
jgi:Big-like domain-containing protein/K319-like protein/HYR domain-containing protein